MNDFQKLEKINDLLLKIKWPDNAEIYMSTMHYPRGVRDHSSLMNASIYISPLERVDEDKSFGKYLTITCASLDLTIEILELELKERQ